MAAPENKAFTTRHWVLIAAASVLAVGLLARAVADPAHWLSDAVAVAILAAAVTSLINPSRRKTG